MKCHAFILLIVASLYVTETLMLPLAIFQKSKHLVCCKKMEGNKMGSCHQDKNQEKNESSSCNALNCSTCPLAYISTFQPALALGNQPEHVVKYPVIECNWTSEYTSRSWKPPDVL